MRTGVGRGKSQRKWRGPGVLFKVPPEVNGSLKWWSDRIQFTYLDVTSIQPTFNIVCRQEGKQKTQSLAWPAVMLIKTEIERGGQIQDVFQRTN